MTALQVLIALGLWLALLVGVLTLTPYQLVGALLALFGGMGLLFRPREALVVCLGLRVLVDMMWWIRATGFGLNVMEIFGAAVTLGVGVLVLLRFKVVEKHPVFPWVFVYAVLMGLATARAPSAVGVAYFFKFVGPLLIFLAIPLVVSDRRWSRHFLVIYLVAAVVPISISLYSILAHTNYEVAAGARRLVGGYMNGTNHALAMTFLAGVGTLWTLHLGRSWRGGLAGLLTLGALVAIYYSNFRSAQLAYAVFVVTLLALQGRYRLLLGVMVLGALIYTRSEIMQDRFGQLYHEAFTEQALEDPMRRMGSGRWELWTTSMAHFLARPPYDWVLGMGIGRHHTQGPGSDPHNDYLSILYQAGPLAVLAYLAVLGRAVRAAATAARDAHDAWSRHLAHFVIAFIAASAVTNFVTNGYASRAAPAWYFMSIVGLAFVLDRTWMTRNAPLAHEEPAIPSFRAEGTRATDPIGARSSASPHRHPRRDPARR